MTELALLAMLANMEAAHGIPEGLLTSVCFVESSLRPNVKVPHDGGSPSLGLCQVKEQTARHVGMEADQRTLMQPAHNAEVAAKYLLYQYRRYNSWVRALIAYNKGHSKTNNPNNYVRKVFTAWAMNDYKTFQHSSKASLYLKTQRSLSHKPKHLPNTFQTF